MTASVRVFGLAAPFWRESSAVDVGEGRHGREVFLPGAFDPLDLVAGQTELRIDHERSSSALGSVVDGTLRVETLDSGLWFDALIADTRAGRVLRAYEDGLLLGASISFGTGRRKRSESRVAVSLVLSVSLLFEISLMIDKRPAYSCTPVCVERFSGD